MIEIPPKLAEYHRRHADDSGPEWTAVLPGLVERFVDDWDLRLDGPPMHGVVSLVLPVRRGDGSPAVLKLQPLTEEHATEAPGLRAWDGDGIVRLLDEATVPGSSRHEANALLLERLDGGRSLETHPDIGEALEILGGLLARLVAHPAPEGMRRLGDIARDMLERVPGAMRQVGPEEARWLDRCAGAVRELAGEPGDRLLHWDLHFDNVLAAEREPWLAIDPKPLAGDPGFELLPALRNRWVSVADGLRRFDRLTEMLALDRRRALGWTLGRVLQNMLWDIEDEQDLNEVELALAEALLQRQ
ncbi:aminoglycoside phosphotransferase family protein [Thermoactinospora rubra]|uniref:aminoglycoside phosphotransferase family protein n=1 Tax=Thermoactinospora rubra TaxID=1088767 RepID=UPI000A11ED65|nr:aminoglycoside phosphotransferase family protein [Thermoactinospora rubra]